MKNKNAFPAKCLFDILLLYINSVGIVGALTESLEIPWRVMGENSTAGGNGLNHIAFWGGLFLFCMAAVLLRSGNKGRKIFLRMAVCLTLYVFCGILFREKLSAGIGMALQNAMANLNGRYGFHIAWPLPGEAAGWSSDWKMWSMTLGILYILFPAELLVGFLGRHDRGFCLIVGNAVWFTVACGCDLFPGYFFLAVCVLGMVTAMIQKDFRERPGAGTAVVGFAAILTGLVMLLVFRFVLPVLDSKYEEMVEGREDFYRMVNEDWLPRVRELLPGSGSGPDVTGQLGRTNVFAYTADEVYRVTVERRPQNTVYLKGFVGGSYGEKAWTAQTDGELEAYYRKQGMELPGSYAALVNIGYQALKALHRSEPPGYMEIEELGGRGSYSIYPYGAMMPEDFQVHGDGSVERRSARYGFSYYAQSGLGRQDVLTKAWEAEEERYRRYVYDNFLEYPEEELPLFTERLKKEKIRTEDIYVCALDIINFLGGQAGYNLDVGNNPAGTDFVEYFLFESREGYCVHFASAAVLALRYFGIPARYVAGYSASPSDFVSTPEGQYAAVLTGKHAHAWAEVYLDSIGWVPVEATPGAVALAGDNRMEQLGELGRLAGHWLLLAGKEEQGEKQIWEYGDGESGREPDYWENLQEKAESEGISLPGAWEEPVEEPEPEAGNREPDPVGTLREEAPEGGEEKGFAWFKLFSAVFWAAFLVCLSALLEKRILRRRRERFRRMSPGERIFVLYRNLRGILGLAGCSGELDADGEEFRQILLEQYDVGREEYEGFCRILEKNTFGREEPSAREAGRIFAFYERLAGRAYERVPFYKKPLVGRYRSYVTGGKEDVGSRVEQG